MTIYRHFLAVSYSEFQCLYNFGEISIIRNRLTAIPLSDSGDPVDDPYHSAIMLGRSPAYDPADEEGILLLSISEVATAVVRSGYVDPSLLSVSFASVESVVPLGQRSFRILGGRLREMGVTLSQPFFEKSARDYRIGKIKQSSLKAGTALVNLLLGGDYEHISEKMAEALGLALYKVEYPDSEISDTSEDKAIDSVVSAVFGYTRHKPVHDSNTDCSEDLGICIGSRYGREAAVVCDYRDAFNAVKGSVFKPGVSLVDILSDESFYSALCIIEKKYTEYFAMHPVSMVAFLKWKDEFHRSDDSLDLLALREECQGLANSLGLEVVGQSLWILGCYIGYDRMATLLYSVTSDALPVFEGARSKISPISYDSQKNSRGESAASEAASHRENADGDVAGSVDAELGDHNDESDPADSPEPSREADSEQENDTVAEDGTQFPESVYFEESHKRELVEMVKAVLSARPCIKQDALVSEVAKRHGIRRKSKKLVSHLMELVDSWAGVHRAEGREPIYWLSPDDVVDVINWRGLSPFGDDRDWKEIAFPETLGLAREAIEKNPQDPVGYIVDVFKLKRRNAATLEVFQGWVDAEKGQQT